MDRGLDVAGMPMIVAGGGGGSAGGHSTTLGLGGNAGLLAAPGVAAGSAGVAGLDAPGAGTPGGGTGGGTAAPGAGGVHSVNVALNGSSGSGRTGGNGGADPNYDSAAGGGGGYHGAGGGASTVAQFSAATAPGVSGGGGGGGSSFPQRLGADGQRCCPDVREQHRRAEAQRYRQGRQRFCDLGLAPVRVRLAVTKSVTPTLAASGQTVTWTVSVSNIGSAPMTAGDVLTVGDTRPGTGAKTITSITTSGGSNALLQRGPVTCDAGVGSPMPATLTCSRPYAAEPGVPGGPFPPTSRGIDPGESLTVTYTQVLADAPGDLTNTATVTDRTPGDSNDSAQASVTVAAPPTAVNDADLGNAIGEAVTLPVLDNDTGELTPPPCASSNPARAPLSAPSPSPAKGRGRSTPRRDR